MNPTADTARPRGSSSYCSHEALVALQADLRRLALLLGQDSHAALDLGQALLFFGDLAVDPFQSTLGLLAAGFQRLLAYELCSGSSDRELHSITGV